METVRATTVEAGQRLRGVDVRVALVGQTPSPILDEVMRRLEGRGWAVHLEDETALPEVASPRRKAVVVVHSNQADWALKALETLDERRNSTLVIVLADNANPGEQYCLMEAGASQFFDAGDDPGRILRGVEWAARALAP